jgi:spore coat protein U-like protein
MFAVRLLAVAVLLLPGIAAAAGSHVLGISAIVVSAGNCRFNNAGPSALAFGAIDPSSGANSTASVNIDYKCSGGGAAPTITWAVTSDDGLYKTAPNSPRMRHTVNAGAYLKYTLNTPLSGTSPKNVNQTLTVTGTVAPADFQNALAGAYADTVVLTIAP